MLQEKTETQLVRKDAFQVAQSSLVVAVDAQDLYAVVEKGGTASGTLSVAKVSVDGPVAKYNPAAYGSIYEATAALAKAEGGTKNEGITIFLKGGGGSFQNSYTPDNA